MRRGDPSVRPGQVRELVGERELRAMAEAWSPWRSVAARILWAYYRVAKDREGIA